MALATTKTREEARRLEIDGYKRKGDKAVEADFNELADLLDRDDVSIRKIALARRNGEQEQAVIDHFIEQGNEGKHYCIRKYRARTSTTSTSNLDRPRALQDKVAKIKEDSMTVYRAFKTVLFNKELPEELLKDKSPTFQEAKEETAAVIENRMEQLKEKRQELEQLEKSDIMEATL